MTYSPPTSTALNEPTYIRVKRAIIGDLIANVLKPGDHVTIDMLTSRYRVSHMPIREALRQLEGEGILVSLAHRGFRIETLSERYIVNMYDIRAGLEAMLTRRAAERATKADLRDLAQVHQEYRQAAQKEEVPSVVALNIRFHDRIHEISDNPEAVQLLDTRTRIVRTVAQSLDAYVKQDRLPIIAEHAAILDAIGIHDSEAASRAVFDHLTKARDRLLTRMIEAGLIEAH